MSKELIEVIEQDAIFDGKPDFIPSGAVINLLNHNALGGTRKDFQHILKSGECENPKRYRVQLHLYIEELT